MNKQTFSIEFSFDVDAGTIELLDDDKWCVNQLITPEVFIERYRNYKLDLMDKTHIDATAQQVLKITENTVKNMENNVMCDVAEGLMVRLARAGYVPENHVFIALDANGNVSCVQPLEFIIDVHCTSESNKEFTRGYVREALIKLISEAVASSVLDGVEIGDVSELNVTIVNK